MIGTMDLTLSSRGDYVVRAAIALAGVWDSGAYRKAREISDEMELPRSYVPELLGLLAEAGLAESRAGRTGGYRLARDPGTISLLEVIEAAEGPLISRNCPIHGGPCRWEHVCALHPTWQTASEAVRSTLAATTLADVASVDRDLGRRPRRRQSGAR
jgi:Rrf2 family protein